MEKFLEVKVIELEKRVDELERMVREFKKKMIDAWYKHDCKIQDIEYEIGCLKRSED